MTDDPSDSDLEDRIAESLAATTTARQCPKGHATGVREVPAQRRGERAFFCLLCGRRWSEAPPA